MKNTAEHHVDLFRLLVVCIDMMYEQEACLEEILIGFFYRMDFTLTLCCSGERQGER